MTRERLRRLGNAVMVGFVAIFGGWLLTVVGLGVLDSLDLINVAEYTR
ncbi:hypothetical protein KIW74_gp58 [Mycobacterium phage Kimona]|uniref:Uncharacterized protein n=1 Tax=Mycobacterium phage Kimona TaxID=2024295 RepID=A0A249XU14_9CAUD|nr:hypothetical protein KIW74_gp58 [Mycobacterium phage Kimona]ASZ75470.1 hypothetical protein PBI_KIMONA_34 [Mycobacterium phage Kimona]